MGQVLGCAQEQMDGSPRSMVAQVIDPVGVCIQKSNLEPYTAPDVVQDDDAYEEELKEEHDGEGMIPADETAEEEAANLDM